MSYCSKISSNDVYKMKEQKLESLLEQCEKTCERYHKCDTIALMEDELKVMRCEAGHCSKCNKIIDFESDFFYYVENEDKYYCENCGDEESLTQCENCGEWFKSGVCEEVDGTMLCPSCLETEE